MDYSVPSCTQILPLSQYHLPLHGYTLLHTFSCEPIIYIGRHDYRTHGHLDSRILGHLDTGILGHLDSWTLGLLDTWTLGHLDSWTLRYLDTWMILCGEKLCSNCFRVREFESFGERFPRVPILRKWDWSSRTPNETYMSYLKLKFNWNYLFDWTLYFNWSFNLQPSSIRQLRVFAFTLTKRDAHWIPSPSPSLRETPTGSRRPRPHVET